MTAEHTIVAPPEHPLPALTTFELRDYRRDLEQALATLGPPARDQLQARLDEVLAEQNDRRRRAGA
jgi:hypothetical protein